MNEDSIRKLYQNTPKGFTISYANMFDEYTTNIMIVFGFTLIILFLYIKNNISIDQKNWNIQKCNPKYLFFSGYIKKNGTRSAYDSTVDNFYDCTTNIAKGTADSIFDSSFKNTMNKLNKDLISFDNQTMEQRKNNEKIFNDNVYDISNQYQSMKATLDISGQHTLLYTNLKTIGIQVDKLNAIMDYIGSYMKQYLTHLMMENANQCLKLKENCDKNNTHYKKAIQLRDILNTYYGGNNL